MSDVEPPLRILTPDGRWAIEVSEGEGRFVIRVILDGTLVTDTLQTKDGDKAIHWAHKQMLEALRRQTDEQSGEARRG